ncbi:hypothetical protein EDB86DRAFT_2832167 [Lactarius hatsudake]|nr:hypothetical protein EDB86DRAFT_2832167 [Lactarius hatsudake]
MTTRRPGCAYLSARAILEHPRYSTDFVIFDAIIHYTPAIDNSPNIICSFRYFNTLTDVTQLLPGSYDIFAKVVAFLPYTHEQSPVRDDDDFVLMGDLLDLCPIPSITDNNPSATFLPPPRLIVSGRVSVVQSDLRSFSVTISQVIRGSTPNARLRVRGIMGLNPTWPCPNRRLPAPNNTITFSGDIMCIEQTGAIIALDDITNTVDRQPSVEIAKSEHLTANRGSSTTAHYDLRHAVCQIGCNTYSKRSSTKIFYHFHCVKALAHSVSEPILPGSYDIFAKVVTFETNTHPPSPVRPDDDFVLMGDVLELRPVLPATVDNPFASWATPAKLSISGRVSIVHNDLHSFSLTISQTIRVQNRRLPIINSTVAFSGDIMSLDNTGAVVALEDIANFPEPHQPHLAMNHQLPNGHTHAIN